MRGEHLSIPSSPSCPMGSSPHARGAQYDLPPKKLGAGLIPACAGSTQLQHVPTSSGWAHPRMRGEHRIISRSVPHCRGSSPHARGALYGGSMSKRIVGLIPACAGSTGPAQGITRPPGAHPRMRGEHGTVSWIVCTLEGSSPHARGARGSFRVSGSICGLIPACAGSTAARIGPPADGWAHPRMRGEHAPHPGQLTSVGGSSPHARGAHFFTCMFPANLPVFHSLSSLTSSLSARLAC